MDELSGQWGYLRVGGCGDCSVARGGVGAYFIMYVTNKRPCCSCSRVRILRGNRVVGMKSEAVSIVSFSGFVNVILFSMLFVVTVYGAA